MQNFRELSQQLDLKPDANRKPVQLFVSAVYLFSLSGVLFYVHHPSIRALLFTASKTIMCTNSGFQRALRGILRKAPCSSQVWDLAKSRQRLPSVTVFMWQLWMKRVQLQCQSHLQHTTFGPAVEHPILFHNSVTHLWSLITHHLLIQYWYHKHFGKVNLAFFHEDVGVSAVQDTVWMKVLGFSNKT